MKKLLQFLMATIILLLFNPQDNLHASSYLGPFLAVDCDTFYSTAYFSLDDCEANESLSNFNYDELTASITNDEVCSILEIVGGNLYRDNPEVNSHSCTQGVNDSVALCVGSEDSCEYTAGSEKTLKFDIKITPGSRFDGILSTLSFYEQAPEYFTWVGGNTGPNNYPTLFAVSISVDGTEIFSQTDIPTNRSWTLVEFDFLDLPGFTVTEPTTFNVEFLAYCRAGVDSPVSAWDIDEIYVGSTCPEIAIGGTLTMEDGETEIEICAGDGVSDAFDVILEGNEGEEFDWVITDTDGNILGLPDAPPFDLEGAGGGVCLVWNLSHDFDLQGLEVGLNVAGLTGCHELSNPITVTRIGVNGGDLATADGETEITICAGDGNSDAFDITLEGNEGPFDAWVITDADGNILELPVGPPFDLEGAGAGVCLIWHLSFDEGLEGAEIGANANDLVGCFDLSNPITVTRIGVAGGNLSTVDGATEVEICAGDGVSDAFDVLIEGNMGTNSAWVITDTDGNILDLPDAPPFDLEGAGSGVCLIWHLSFEDGLEGAEVGANAADLTGCFVLSNPITVTRIGVNGGDLATADGETEITICAGDGNSDAFEISLEGNEGTNSAWVITDADANILELPSGPPFDLEGAGAGVCLVWHLSFEDGLEGAEVGANAADLTGCFALSNPITVNRIGVNGGDLATADGETEITICAGDGNSDAFDISLEGNEGTNSAWVITDADANILELPSGPPFDLEGAGAGVCLVWHLSFEDGLEGAEVGANAADLTGCFVLSNPITVTRIGVNGGDLATADGETEITICAGDGNSDAFEISLEGNEGTNSAWVITDTDANILDLPSGPPFDLEGAGAGVCLVWHLSFEDGLEGAEVGANAADLTGCFALSNPITVNRTGVNGGDLATADGETEITICAGDGNSDAFDISLEGNEGTNSAWVITDTDGNILDLPSGPPFDLEGAGAGVCLVWHLSFEDGLEGAEEGANAADLTGCFALSNPITVNRTGVNGGELATADGETEITICAGDGNSDAFDISLEGNEGTNSAWVITDTDGNILGLPTGPPFDLEEAGAGVCLVWHLSFEDGLEGAEEGANAADLTGCFALSNPITVTRNVVLGGELTTSDGERFVDICVGDGVSDAFDVVLTGAEGESSAWIITDEFGEILALPDAPPFDLEEAGPGECLIWHLSYTGEVTGLEVGLNALAREGCSQLSTPITVIRSSTSGGTLALADGSTELEICAGDGESDAFEVVVEGAEGTNSAWVITDTEGNILDLPAGPPFDLEGAGAGVCLLWYLSFEDGLEGAEVGANASDLSGCFSLSNAITVTRNGVNGGDLSIASDDGGTEITICAGDGESDAFDVNLENAEGTNSAWVITDEEGNILDLPDGPPFDLEEAGEGVCLIWHLSFEDGLEGAGVDLNAADLVGCFDLSNPITVTRKTGENCGNGFHNPGGEMNFAIYPNPSNDKIYLDVKSSPDLIVQYQIIDLLGNIVINKQTMDLEGDLELDVSMLNTGRFYVKMIAERSTAVQTFIIIR